ncbi:hypothetical protein BLNAU_17584 [Blattamonas nauphoetae]|uniref:Uncharacterized protein n=1 Tax=Blattamonas nauphoetae TaxID=2049346 RepID=A0ABQ9X6T3_9EUKA|nr:hypothetical protein BLNAU_17584 [Blattamonas nauphoetae]
MLFDKDSSTPHGDNAKVKDTKLVEVFLRQLGGECKPLHPEMLNSLLILAKEYDWAISAILDVGYIRTLEQYCKTASLSTFPPSLPRLLYLLGKTSEAECIRICESSIPYFLLDLMTTDRGRYMIECLGDCLFLLTSSVRSSSTLLAHHKTKFLAVIAHFEDDTSDFEFTPILAELCFSPHLEVSRMALKALYTRSQFDLQLFEFLQESCIRSNSTDSSSERVPFAERLCSMLAERVSQITSRFIESSFGDPANPALSTTLHDESPSLTRDAVLEVLSKGLSLLGFLLVKRDHPPFETILIDSNFVPLLKSIIIVCLDLRDREKTQSTCPPAHRSDLLIKVLDRVWDCVATCVCSAASSIKTDFRRVFADIPQLCSLLERTCRRSSPTRTSHLKVIIDLACYHCRLIPRLLEENLVQRVIDTSKPMSVLTTHGQFHLRLIWTIVELIDTAKRDLSRAEECTRIRMLQFERALKPAKQYLQFIFQRDEFIMKGYCMRDIMLSMIHHLLEPELSSRITDLLDRTLRLERDLFNDGEIVETGREEWEVGWLVEKTDEDGLGLRLERIREDDETMKKDEKERWKKRVGRQREAGHEDAIEGWLMKKESVTSTRIVKYLQSVSEERGMNLRF